MRVQTEVYFCDECNANQITASDFADAFLIGPCDVSEFGWTTAGAQHYCEDCSERVEEGWMR